MKKCPICDSQFPDDRLFCPDCGAKLVGGEPPPPSAPAPGASVSSSGTPSSPRASASAPAPSRQSKRLFVILSIVTAVAVLAVICLAFQIYDYSERLDNTRLALSNSNSQLTYAKNDLEKAKNEMGQVQLDLEQARNDMVQLQMELDKLGGIQNLYGYGSANYYAEESVVVLRESESKEITIYANLAGTYYKRSSSSGITSEWSKAWSAHRTQVTITGNSAGYYTIQFTNDQNSDSFDVLVIVTE